MRRNIHLLVTCSSSSVSRQRWVCSDLISSYPGLDGHCPGGSFSLLFEVYSEEEVRTRLITASCHISVAARHLDHNPRLL